MTNEAHISPARTKAPGPYRMLRRYLRLYVSARPKLYAAYARLGGLQFQLTETTQVLVDSYPRSANSFFEAAFTRAHGGRLEVAHHSHAAGQVLMGVKRGLPAIVLLREPRGAIASFYEMNDGDYPIELCTREYVVFYTALRSVIDRLVVVETATLENRFFALMTLLRDRYGLNVEPYEITPRVRAELMRDVDETGRRRNGFSAERYSDSLSLEEKKARRDRLDRIITMIEAPANAGLLARAEALFEEFRTHAF